MAPAVLARKQNLSASPAFNASAAHRKLPRLRCALSIRSLLAPAVDPLLHSVANKGHSNKTTNDLGNHGPNLSAAVRADIPRERVHKSGMRVHSPFDGGIPVPRSPSSPRRHALARAWTSRRRWVDRLNPAVKSLTGSPDTGYPIASPLGASRSVHLAVSTTRLPGRRACGVKCGDVHRQVHRGQDLFGDVFGLNEGDQAQRGLALRADNLKTERPARRLSTG